MPTPPQQRFYNRLNKLRRDLRQTRTDYSTICPKQSERYAVNKIEQICERDITSQSAILRPQNEVTDALTDVAFALKTYHPPTAHAPACQPKGILFDTSLRTYRANADSRPLATPIRIRLVVLTPFFANATTYKLWEFYRLGER